MVGAVGYVVAGAPFLVAGVVLFWLRWSVARAGVIALAAAIAGALFWPELDSTDLLGALQKGLGTTGTVLYVLFGGLVFFNVLSAGGAVERVSQFLTRLEPEREALALLVVIGVAPFFESVTGFGVAVVISAPILLSAGFAPLRAAALATWGQVIVPWGALAVGTLLGANLAGITFGELSNTSALLNLPLFPVYGVATVALAGGFAGVRRRGLEAAFLSLVAGLGVLLTSLYLIPELAGVVGGLAATGAFLLPRAGRLRGLEIPARALAPYGVLLALLTVASIGVVQAALETLGPVLTGPGAWLLVSAAFAAFFLLKLGGEAAISAVWSTLKQWLPVAGAILAFTLTGQVVASSGAAGLLARGVAGNLGQAYPALSALVGALGGALLGSNAGSNALFMPFQVAAANTAGSSVLVLAAIQNVAGSQATLLAPAKFLLAATATGLVGKEAEMARYIAPPVVLSLAILILAGVVYG